MEIKSTFKEYFNECTNRVKKFHAEINGQMTAVSIAELEQEIGTMEGMLKDKEKIKDKLFNKEEIQVTLKSMKKALKDLEDGKLKPVDAQQLQ